MVIQFVKAFLEWEVRVELSTFISWPPSELIIDVGSALEEHVEHNLAWSFSVVFWCLPLAKVRSVAENLGSDVGTSLMVWSSSVMSSPSSFPISAALGFASSLPLDTLRSARVLWLHMNSFKWALANGLSWIFLIVAPSTTASLVARITRCNLITLAESLLVSEVLNQRLVLLPLLLELLFSLLLFLGFSVVNISHKWWNFEVDRKFAINRIWIGCLRGSTSGLWVGSSPSSNMVRDWSQPSSCTFSQTTLDSSQSICGLIAIFRVGIFSMPLPTTCPRISFAILLLLLLRLFLCFFFLGQLIFLLSWRSWRAITRAWLALSSRRPATALAGANTLKPRSRDYMSGNLMLSSDQCGFRMRWRLIRMSWSARWRMSLLDIQSVQLCLSLLLQSLFHSLVTLLPVQIGLVEPSHAIGCLFIAVHVHSLSTKLLRSSRLVFLLSFLFFGFRLIPGMDGRRISSWDSLICVLLVVVQSSREVVSINLGMLDVLFDYVHGLFGILSPLS